MHHSEKDYLQFMQFEKQENVEQIMELELFAQQYLEDIKLLKQNILEQIKLEKEIR